jgi:DNA invertase Pin-like site-specific DNA recombinase
MEQTTKKKAISYLRFSTPEQALGNSSARQLKAAREYCERNGLVLDLDLSISDEGQSGYKGDNLKQGADLGDFLTAVKSGKIPAGTSLIVENLDRLSRQGIDKTTDLLKALTQSGIDVHVIALGRVLKAGFNNSLVDYMLIGVQADLAYQESEKKSQRVLSAWAAKRVAAASGALLTSNIPAWLKVGNDGKIVQCHEYASSKKVEHVPVAMVKEMFSMASQGIGSKNICRHFKGVISRSFVTKTLCSRAVLGEFKQKGSEVIYKYFPQVISQSEFDAVRSQMIAKRRNGKYVGGNKFSDSADNLFSGFIFDITSEPAGRAMYYQNLRDGRQYLETAFNAKGKHDQHRTRYGNIEHSILAFLEKEDWVAIAGQSESEEYRAAKVELESTLTQLDKVSRHIEMMKSAMEGEDIETVKVAIRSVAKDEAAIIALKEKETSLNQALEAATAKHGALYEGEELKELIKQTVNDSNLRLRLRTELRKRIARIELVFMPNQFGIGIIVRFVNGTQGFVCMFGEATREAALRRGHKEVEIRMAKPGADLRALAFELAAKAA